MTTDRDNLFLSTLQKQILIDFSRAHSTPKIVAMRANIILLLAEQNSVTKIRGILCISYPPIYKWRARWMKDKKELDDIEKTKSKHELKIAIQNALQDSARSGSPPSFTEEQVLQIIALACTAPSEENLPVSHWSCRLLAEIAKKKGIVEGISHSQVYVFLKSRADKTTQSKMLVKL